MFHKKISSSTDDVFGGRQTRIHRVELVSGATATAVTTLYDCVTAGLNDFGRKTISSAAEGDMSWGSEGLVVDYLSVTLSGTGAALYLYYN